MIVLSNVQNCLFIVMQVALFPQTSAFSSLHAPQQRIEGGLPYMDPSGINVCVVCAVSRCQAPPHPAVRHPADLVHTSPKEQHRNQNLLNKASNITISVYFVK